jgi:CHAT domain-containing protein/tetratricopeptide (TPR) repeat protein
VAVSSPEECLTALTQIRNAADQRAYISNATSLPTQNLIESVSTKIRELLPRDPDLAEILAETNLYMASLVDTPLAWAYANRSRAQVLYTMRKSADAEPFFARAVELFEKADLAGEVGRTLVGQMDNLMYLSRYTEALTVAQSARSALQKVNDVQYLSRLEIALGNLYYRLNKYSESLAHYDQAQKTLENTEDFLAIASIGLNRAYVLTEMNRFDEAVQCFEVTKVHCERHGMTLWAAIADRGISQMHFRRGNYSTALRILEQVRRKHEELADARRVGLCDMDRAEIYLELNLFDDAATIAARAHETFDRLGNRYEAGKCLTYQGIAEFKLLKDKDAERALVRAREIFQKEGTGNDVWVAVIDLWRAQLLTRQQQFSTAQELAQHAAEIFERQQAPARAANARVLSAQSWLELAETAPALQEAQKALDEIEGYHAPWVSYQCYNTLGRLKELSGALEEAEQLYTKAIDQMESLRGNIRLDEMRMSFGRDKYQVYENMVNLKIARGDERAAFQFVERSKSRTLIDLLERNLEAVWDAGVDESPRLQRIRKIREELNIFYSRLNEVGATARAAAADTITKDEISRREQELVELLREVGSEKSGWATLQSMKIPAVDEVNAMLGPDEVLVEYYTIGDRFQAFIIGHSSFDVVRDITTMNAVRASLKGLTFQLSKFHLQSSYVQTHAERLLEATQYHLQQLYMQLIEPIQHKLSGRSIVFIPHNILHYLPFQALFDGNQYLIERFDVARAASTSVLKICRDKKIQRTEQDLVLAVADEMTPYINEEVEALRQLLPKGLFFVGSEAREDKLRRYGQTAGKLHIAAHGIFRADNPMFSSIKLGDSWLNLFDIFNLQLGAELTVLSACETGMSAVWEGDELLGLARGFLYAGTPSLVVSLWTVNDRSTAQLMRHFYEGLQNGLNKARALQDAVLKVKSCFPHPYYWAPFILMGKS